MSSTSYERYVVGLLGTYTVPTTSSVDSHLRALSDQLATVDRGAGRARLMHDIDLLLDHRTALGSG